MDVERKKNQSFASPVEMAQEIAKITKDAQAHPRPAEPVHELTALEHAEQKGLDVPVDRIMNATIVISIVTGVVVGLITWNDFVGLMTYLAMTAVSVAGVAPALFWFTKPKGGRFWARVIRKKRYLELHKEGLTQRQIAQQAHEQALAKHQKVMKRMRKRAKPVIDAYNAKNPLKELVLTEGQGFVEHERYKPAQQQAMSLAQAIFEDAPAELESETSDKQIAV